MKELRWIHEGLITELLANGVYWIRLNSQNMILSYVSGRIRHSFFYQYYQEI
uniref:Translational initiation factor n=6 Tax=Elaeagnus TaxID=36776 RepID=A0A8F2JKN7_ELAUM|nr:translational initiation factor 1 [Elaeagnus henryi]QWT89100.1 Translational initiation factor [Elaeagnus umbellata]UJH18089.1 translational initiation factor 1 [Elaeagnus henryi]